MWLFDLDNTLHNASAEVFPHINSSMTAYLVEHLQLSEEEASALRVSYWHRYGATLLGLMKHHGTDPEHFLWHTHQFPDLPRMLVYERALRAMLRRLPGRKIVFSNSPRHYAKAVLAAMRLRQSFDAVAAIQELRYQPKPSIKGFLHLIRSHGLVPNQCVLVEDSLENLLTARQLGMKTVWVSRRPRSPAWVDVRIESVLRLPRIMQKLAVA